MKKVSLFDLTSTSPLFVNAKDAAPMGLADRGEYSDHQAVGAYPNGTRVRKVLFQEGDTHAIGSLATVLGSAGPVKYAGEMMFGYFVRWDAMPDAAVFVAGKKIAKL